MPRYMLLNFLSFKQCKYAWCVDGTRKLHRLLWKSQHLKKWWPGSFSSVHVQSQTTIRCLPVESILISDWLATVHKQCFHFWLAGYSTQTVFSPVIDWLQYTVGKALHLCWIPSQRIKSYHPNMSFKSLLPAIWCTFSVFSAPGKIGSLTVAKGFVCFFSLERQSISTCLVKSFQPKTDQMKLKCLEIHKSTIL